MAKEKGQCRYREYSERTVRYLLVGEIKNKDPKVEYEPSKSDDKEVATGQLEHLKDKDKIKMAI